MYFRGDTEEVPKQITTYMLQLVQCFVQLIHMTSKIVTGIYIFPFKTIQFLSELLMFFVCLFLSIYCPTNNKGEEHSVHSRKDTVGLLSNGEEVHQQGKKNIYKYILQDKNYFFYLQFTWSKANQKIRNLEWGEEKSLLRLAYVNDRTQHEFLSLKKGVHIGVPIRNQNQEEKDRQKHMGIKG